MTATPQPEPEITVLDRFEDFLALEAEWEALHAAAERPISSQRHAWLRVSWQSGGLRLGQRLRVVLVRQGGVLMMAGAFVRRFHRLTPIVELLGSNTPQMEDVLWRRSDRSNDYALRMLRALRAGDLLPRTLRLHRLRADSPLHAAFAGLGLTVRIRYRSDNFVVPISRYVGFDSYLASLGRHLRPDHGRRLRRLAELPGYRYERLVGAAADEAIAWLLETKRGWLVDKHKRAPWLESRRIDRFLTRFLAARGAPPYYVTALRTDAGLIAAQLCFVERNQLSLTKIAHDPAYDRFSPGRTLVLLTIADAFADAVDAIDLGLGATPLKLQLAAERGAVSAMRVRLK